MTLFERFQQERLSALQEAQKKLKKQQDKKAEAKKESKKQKEQAQERAKQLTTSRNYYNASGVHTYLDAIAQQITTLHPDVHPIIAKLEPSSSGQPFYGERIYYVSKKHSLLAPTHVKEIRVGTMPDGSLIVIGENYSKLALDAWYHQGKIDKGLIDKAFDIAYQNPRRYGR